MELNEALRRTVVGHWILIVALTVLPVLVVAALHLSTAPTYSAAARVQASSTPPGSDTEADAVLSRVAGIATSSTVINQALADAKITGRAATAVAPEIGVSRLGTSAVFDVSVTDRDPAVAVAVSGAVARQLVGFLDGAGSPQPNALLDQLNKQRAALQGQRTQLATNLALATDPVQVANLSAQLATVDQELTNVASSLRDVQTVNLQSSSAAVISTPTQATRVPTKMTSDLVLAALAGLIASLLIATILEVVRPRVADARAFARELGAPVLGRLNGPRDRGDADGIARPDVRVALRRAVDRSTSSTVVLTSPAGHVRLAALAAELRAGFAERAAPESSGNGSLPVLSGDLSGELEARTVTLPSMRDLPDAGTVEVLPLSDVDEFVRGQRIALVAVVPDLTPYAEVRRINDLLATTGWPVIGVLGDPIRLGRLFP
ncbi:MAG TPA: hypothetical protein VHV49_11240 [Pseudonocardiaceae bacterium]|nr:hypothetical protein [Pseudonocardiaceae bacterium]